MKLDMIGIVVSDMNKALEFYQALGFTVSADYGGDYKELNNDGVRLSLNTQSMVAGIYGYQPVTVGDRIELAFLCTSPQEVDEITNRMVTKGYSVFKMPWDAGWGQRYAIIKDVDGHLISLFATLDS